jgi:hypothetical protein
MTVMCAEYINEDMIAVSVEDRRWLYEHRQAPHSGWRIWIAGIERPGQVRFLLDKRVGDAVTVAFTAGAVRSAWARSSSSRIAVS